MLADADGPVAPATSSTADTAATAAAGSAPRATAAATAWAALPRFTAPGSVNRIGRDNPSGPCSVWSSNHHCGLGRLKSAPVENQWPRSRTMTSPLRGQLTESFDHEPPAATHTTLGLS